MVGVGAAAVLRRPIVAFAALPNVESFAGFSLVMGLFLVPAGAPDGPTLADSGVLSAMAANFVPLLAPTNPMSYDNRCSSTTPALGGSWQGCGKSQRLSFRLLPPLSPGRADRAAAGIHLCVTCGASPPIPHLHSPEDWGGSHVWSASRPCPNAAEPLAARRHLMAALAGRPPRSLHLRRIAPQLGLGRRARPGTRLPLPKDSLQPRAPSSASSIAVLRRGVADAGWQTSLAARARGRILLIRDALGQHGAYFDMGGPG